jgi:hypothetical protein
MSFIEQTDNRLYSGTAPKIVALLRHCKTLIRAVYCKTALTAATENKLLGVINRSLRRTKDERFVDSTSRVKRAN